MEHLGTKLLAKKREEAERKGETVWEAYLRKRREKRKERKHGRRLGRGERDGESSDSDEYDEVEDERPGRGNPNGKKVGAGDMGTLPCARIKMHSTRELICYINYPYRLAFMIAYLYIMFSDLYTMIFPAPFSGRRTKACRRGQ